MKGDILVQQWHTIPIFLPQSDRLDIKCVCVCRWYDMDTCERSCSMACSWKHLWMDKAESKGARDRGNCVSIFVSFSKIEIAKKMLRKLKFLVHRTSRNHFEAVTGWWYLCWVSSSCIDFKHSKAKHRTPSPQIKQQAECKKRNHTHPTKLIWCSVNAGHYRFINQIKI